jgi:hypothetical protein
LVHQEDRVRNRYRKFNLCIAFALASSLSLLAQSDRGDLQGRDDLPLRGDPTLVLTAKLALPVIDNRSNDDLPDAPSASKPDTTPGDAASSPAVKKNESQGAPPAAVGGPLWLDRSVADRNYFALTGGMVVASVATVELTLQCLNKHEHCNDVPPSLQSRTALYGIGIPADLGVAYLTFCMKRKHSSIWYVPAAVVTGANIFLSYRAYRWSQDPPIPGQPPAH